MDLWKSVREIEEDVVAYRRSIHENPELSLKEFDTADFVESVLKKIEGIDSIRRISPTGILAEVRGRKQGEGRCIALRGDMDALPGDEMADVPFKSKRPGVVHSCGHDVHTALLLGAARILARHRDMFAGTVKFFFQPAEEVLGGAIQFLGAGALENPKVDAAVGIHVFSEHDAGIISSRKGPMLAGADGLTIGVKGCQSHAAHPHTGRDAVVIAGQVIGALQTISSRFVAPTDPVVVTIGQINGGIARNIIAGSVTLEGTIRTVKPETRDRVHREIEKMVPALAEAMGGSAVVDIQRGTPPLVCDDGLVDRLQAVTEKLIGKDRYMSLPDPSMGGEDFAFIMEKVPGLFIRLGVKRPGGPVTPGHSVDFFADESAIAPGLAVFAGMALDFLGVPLE